MLKKLALFTVFGVLLGSLFIYVKPADALASLKFKNPKVVLISIDGLKSDFYMDQKYEMNFVRSLMEVGTYAKGMIPSFPSVTYPNHTTLITGLRPGKHGILSNSLFDWELGPQPAWFWERTHIKSDTLFDLTKKAGLTSASVRWPVTVGDESVTWLVPEIFPMKPYYEGTTFDLTVKLTKKELMDEILKNIQLQTFEGEEAMDNWVAQATAYLAQTKLPDLTAVHLANLDHVEHGNGPEGPKVEAAIKLADSHVKTIVEKLDLKETCVIVTGDHGFYAVSKKINVNSLFVKQGWITLDNAGKLKSFKVIAQSSGGQAAIYLKDKSLEADVLKVLKDNVSAGYEILEKADLEKWGAYPEASFAVSGKEGFTISGSFSETLVEPSSVLGNHGHLPTPKMYTGFIAAGCGIQKNVLEPFDNTRVAPTVAALLGFQVANADGKPISLK